MRHKDVWNEKIDGVYCEFVRWADDLGKEHWNYYLYITDKMVNAETMIELLSIKPGEYSICYLDSFLAELDWHYGITFCEFLYDGNGRIYGVKAGCDYSHYWDEGNTYVIDDLLRDAARTVESLSARRKVE